MTPERNLMLSPTKTEKIEDVKAMGNGDSLQVTDEEATSSDLSEDELELKPESVAEKELWASKLLLGLCDESRLPKRRREDEPETGGEPRPLILSGVPFSSQVQNGGGTGGGGATPTAAATTTTITPTISPTATTLLPSMLGAGQKPIRTKKRRGKLPEAATVLLKKWLFEHWLHPYPSEEEKSLLCSQTHLSLNQINNWFTNARRRILPKSKLAQPIQIPTPMEITPAPAPPPLQQPVK
jgi:hypothetical protein